MSEIDSSQFYSGLIASFYDALANDLDNPETSKKFVKENGSPALELACGTGHPMLDLISEGMEVHGLDSSRDMLDLCLSKALDRKLEVKVFYQRMQELDAPYRYKCCYLAGESFCLIDDPDHAQQTIDAVFSHLEPGGRFRIPIFKPDISDPSIFSKTITKDDGSEISIQSISQLNDEEKQIIKITLLFEEKSKDLVINSVLRNWILRWYTCEQLSAMLCKVGFEVESSIDHNSKPADLNENNFVIVAKRPLE